MSHPEATAIIGTTSYGFRYQLLDERRAPPLTSLVQQAAAAGLQALQICENARPLAVSRDEWRAAVRAGRDLNVQLYVGCMTLSVDVLSRYLELASDIPRASTVRLVMEEEAGKAPSRSDIERFLEQAALRAADSGMTLVLENHFHVACRTLAEVCAAYPADAIAFCVDSANSLRKWESPEQVFDLLGERAAFYHLKDFRVLGSNVGFTVAGAPLGSGDLDLGATLGRVLAKHPVPVIFLENWVPATGDRDIDVAADAEWLGRSLATLRPAISELLARSF
jgi:sugar phosphate isomerase/epimerase